MMSESILIQSQSQNEGASTIHPVQHDPRPTAEEEAQERPTTASPPTLDDFQCPVCLETFIDAVESDCHHRFCNYCLHQWFRTRRNKHCPVCRTEITTISVLDEVNATIEARFSEIMTPQQLSERNSTKRMREDVLSRPPRVYGDEEDMRALIRDEIFPPSPSTEDLAWQFELDLEDAVLSNGVFSRFNQPRHERRSLSPLRRRPIRGARAFDPLVEYEYAPPFYTPQHRHPFRPFRIPPPRRRRENQSDESDSDGVGVFDRYASDPITYTPRRNVIHDESIQNHMNFTTSESLEDLRSLRETIRQAEASVANPQGEQSDEDLIHHRTHYHSSYTRERNEESGRTMTPDQDALLAEFHQRFHQTELAFDAATMAQNQLDTEGARLREIYNRCVAAGLLDHGYPRSQDSTGIGGGGSQAAGSTDFTGHPSFPSYTAFLQHTFNRGIPPFTPTFDGISSPYYQTIWSTYLTNYNHHYHSDIPDPRALAHAHAQEHNHTWYQRCLNSHVPPTPPTPTPPEPNYYPRSRLSSRAGPIRHRHPSGPWDHHHENSNSNGNYDRFMSRMMNGDRHPRPGIGIRAVSRLQSELAAMGLGSPRRVRQSVSENLSDEYQINQLDQDLEEAVRRSMAHDSSGGESDHNEETMLDLLFEEHHQNHHQHQHFESNHDHGHNLDRREPTPEEGHSSEPEHDHDNHEGEEMNVQVEIGFQLGVHYH